MKHNRFNPRRRTLLAAMAAACAVPAVLAQSAFPSRTVRLMVGFAAGGAVDNVARIVGQALAPRLGQPVIIENRAGATGVLAADAVAKATPDGYTLLLATQSTMLVAPALYPKLPFKPLQDLAPIFLIGSVPLVLVVNPSLPVRNVDELIKLARSRSGELAYASAGLGGPQHVATELLAQMAGVKLVHVPYKGEAPALTDVIGGQVPFMFGNLPTMLPHMKGGKVRALAVSTLQRSEALPDLPTIAESGLAGFDAATWFGLFAPAGAPAEVIERVARDTRTALLDAGLREKLYGQGLSLNTLDAAEFKRYMQTESVKWARLVQAADIKPE